jgi:hypothetical protein
MPASRTIATLAVKVAALTAIFAAGVLATGAVTSTQSAKALGPIPLPELPPKLVLPPKFPIVLNPIINPICLPCLQPLPICASCTVATTPTTTTPTTTTPATTPTTAPTVAATATTASAGSSGGPTTFGLSVSKGGSGEGTISSSSGSISCPGTCSAAYASGTSVTLTAGADPSSFFAGWSGACSGQSRTCVVRVGSAASVTASFVKPMVAPVKAEFSASWRAGRVRGALLVSGTANVDSILTATLKRPAAPPVNLPLEVKNGTFNAQAQLPAALLPGVYSLAVSGAVNGVQVAPVELHGVVLKPSPVGVVSGAYFSLSAGGSKVKSVPASAKQLWVHMPFVAMPKGSPHLTVQWTKPDGTPATPQPAAVKLRKTIVTGIAITRAADKGIWTIVLRSGNTSVFQTNIQAG